MTALSSAISSPSIALASSATASSSAKEATILSSTASSASILEDHPCSNETSESAPSSSAVGFESTISCSRESQNSSPIPSLSSSSSCNGQQNIDKEKAQLSHVTKSDEVIKHVGLIGNSSISPCSNDKVTEVTSSESAVTNVARDQANLDNEVKSITFNDSDAIDFSINSNVETSHNSKQAAPTQVLPKTELSAGKLRKNEPSAGVRLLATIEHSTDVLTISKPSAHVLTPIECSAGVPKTAKLSERSSRDSIMNEDIANLSASSGNELPIDTSNTTTDTSSNDNSSCQRSTSSTICQSISNGVEVSAACRNSQSIDNQRTSNADKEIMTDVNTSKSNISGSETATSAKNEFVRESDAVRCNRLNKFNLEKLLLNKTQFETELSQEPFRCTHEEDRADLTDHNNYHDDEVSITVPNSTLESTSKTLADSNIITSMTSVSDQSSIDAPYHLLQTDSRSHVLDYSSHQLTSSPTADNSSPSLSVSEGSQFEIFSPVGEGQDTISYETMGGLKQTVTIHRSEVLVSRLEGVISATGESIAMYQCHLCKKMFQQLVEIQCHLTSHSERRHITLFQCRLCDANFPRKTRLLQHLRWRHRMLIPRKDVVFSKRNIELSQAKSVVNCSHRTKTDAIENQNGAIEENIVAKTKMYNEKERVKLNCNRKCQGNSVNHIIDDIRSECNTNEFSFQYCNISNDGFDKNMSRSDPIGPASTIFSCSASQAFSASKTNLGVTENIATDRGTKRMFSEVDLNESKERICKKLSGDNLMDDRKKSILACRECRVEFSNRRNLLEHIIDRHADSRYHSEIKRELITLTAKQLQTNSVDDSYRRDISSTSSFFHTSSNRSLSAPMAVGDFRGSENEIFDALPSGGFSAQNTLSVNPRMDSAVRNSPDNSSVSNKTSVNSSSLSAACRPSSIWSKNAKQESKSQKNLEKEGCLDNYSNLAEISDDDDCEFGDVEIKSVPIKSLLSPRHVKPKKRHHSSASQSSVKTDLTTAVDSNQATFNWLPNFTSPQQNVTSSTSNLVTTGLQAGSNFSALLGKNFLTQSGFSLSPLVHNVTGSNPNYFSLLSLFLNQSALAASLAETLPAAQLLNPIMQGSSYTNCDETENNKSSCISSADNERLWLQAASQYATSAHHINSKQFDASTLMAEIALAAAARQTAAVLDEKTSQSTLSTSQQIQEGIKSATGIDLNTDISSGSLRDTQASALLGRNQKTPVMQQMQTSGRLSETLNLSADKICKLERRDSFSPDEDLNSSAGIISSPENLVIKSEYPSTTYPLSNDFNSSLTSWLTQNGKSPSSVGDYSTSQTGYRSSRGLANSLEARLAMEAALEEEDWSNAGEKHMEGFAAGKGTSLSKTQSRLYVVAEPVKRNEAFKAVLQNDGQTIYRCNYCTKDFNTVSDINRHMDFHEDIRPYKCSHCNYHARTNSQLKVHNMRHQGIRKYQCSLCNYKGVTQSDLNRHSKSQIHMLKSRNQCGTCGEGFVSPINLGRHYHERHVGNQAAVSMTTPSSAMKPLLKATGGE